MNVFTCVLTPLISSYVVSTLLLNPSMNGKSELRAIVAKCSFICSSVSLLFEISKKFTASYICPFTTVFAPIVIVLLSLVPLITYSC